MKKLVISLLLVVCSYVNGVAQGISFQKENFEQVLAMAKKDGKLIFIDFYTEWCGPCKMMSNSVFPKKEVGDLMNANFYSLKLNAELEGKKQAKDYGVTAYPTLLFIDGDGTVIRRKMGAIDTEEFLVTANGALKDSKDENSFINMKKNFEANRENAKFLKSYIAKKLENSESVIDEIELYLKAEKSIKPNGADMFEFFLDHKMNMIVGGAAEKIFLANYDEFFSFATKTEEKTIASTYKDMINKTREVALERKDAELYRTFLNRWKAEKDVRGNRNDFELELLLLEGNNDGYKQYAKHYLDSVIMSKTPEEIQKENLANFEATTKRMAGRQGSIVDQILENSKSAVSNQVLGAIMKIGNQYLMLAKNKKEQNDVIRWAAYGDQITTTNFRAKDFYAQVLYYVGKKKEGIAMRREVVEKMDKNEKAYEVIKSALKEWENETIKK